MSKEYNNQLTFPLVGNDKPSFENFLVGDNVELIAALKSSVRGQELKVMYLYGRKGCGKSHLSFAVTRLANQCDVVSSYLSLQDAYVNEAMLSTIDVSGLVCIDNVHSWAGDNAKERALFTLFEQIKHAHGRLIITSTQAPEMSGFVLPDLVSRLASGLIYALQELDDEQRFLALKMRANHRGLVVADEALRYLVSRVSRDTAQLFSFLEKMDKASLIEQRKITIPFLQNLLNRDMD